MAYMTVFKPPRIFSSFSRAWIFNYTRALSVSFLYFIIKLVITLYYTSLTLFSGRFSKYTSLTLFSGRFSKYTLLTLFSGRFSKLIYMNAEMFRVMNVTGLYLLLYSTALSHLRLHCENKMI